MIFCSRFAIDLDMAAMAFWVDSFVEQGTVCLRNFNMFKDKVLKDCSNVFWKLRKTDLVITNSDFCMDTRISFKLFLVTYPNNQPFHPSSHSKFQTEHPYTYIYCFKVELSFQFIKFRMSHFKYILVEVTKRVEFNHDCKPTIV